MKSVCRVFTLLWYFCKYLPGSGAREEIWDLLLPWGVPGQERVSSPWPLRAPDCSLRVCLVLLQLGGGGNEHLGVLWFADDVSPTVHDRTSILGEVTWGEAGGNCYGVCWLQWHVTELQWLLTLKLLFRSLSSAVRHLLLLPPYPFSTSCLLALLVLCKLWQPRWRDKDEKSADQGREWLLMPRYCVKCICSGREGCQSSISTCSLFWKQIQHSFPCYE